MIPANVEGKGWKSLSVAMKHVLSMHISTNQTPMLARKLDRTTDKGKEMRKQIQCYTEVVMRGTRKQVAMLGHMGRLSVLQLKDKDKKGHAKSTTAAKKVGRDTIPETGGGGPFFV